MVKESLEILSVLVPVYNERAYITRCIDNILNAPLPAGLDCELIIVDDCSTDGTYEVLQELERQHPGVIFLFRQDHNRGKGAAIRKAISEMHGDYAIFQDADLEYNPEQYKTLLDPILSGHADVVYGSRFAYSSCRRVLNYHHALGNRFITFLSNICTGLCLSDIESCYKLFKADILRTIPIRSDRFGIEPEITAKIAKRDCVVYEVPISYYGRSYMEGKKITWRDGLEALYIILKYKLIDDCFNERYGHAILRELNSARRFNKWLIKIIEPWLGNRILEIGSGIGNISRQLPKKTLLTTSDYEDEYIKILSQAFQHDERVNVEHLDLSKDEGFEKLAGKYDSVICLNVLEHIDDDESALRRMGSLLSPGGYLIVQVPQYRFLMSKLDRKIGHFRRYNKKVLSHKMESVGLIPDRILNMNALGLLGWLVNNKLLGRVSFGKFQLKIFDMLVPIMGLCEKWLPHPGLSIIAVARKGPDSTDTVAECPSENST